MRYWAYFLGKLAVLGGLLGAAWWAMNALWPKPEPFMYVDLAPFARDLNYTLAVMLFCLIGVGLLYLVILDQRYRCRTCLRRLRMPVMLGAFNHLLLESPRTEYICPYGHGTLRVPEAGGGGVDWKPIGDMWKELEELEEARK